MRRLRFVLRAALIVAIGASIVSYVGHPRSVPTIASADELRGPHYLNGEACRPLGDPVKQVYRVHREMLRVAVEMSHVQSQPFGAGLRRTVKVLGKDVEIVLRDYQRAPDGSILFYGSNGIRKLPASQEDVIFDDLRGVIQEAATIGYAQRARLTRDVIAIQSRIVGDDVARVLGAKIDPSLGDLTYGGILGTPILDRASYVPDQVVYTPMSRAMGISFLVSRFGGRRLIYYSPEARVYDCLLGKPIIMLHEMFHANPQMEPAPWAYQFDVELWAALEEYPQPFMDDAFFHPYVRAVRELARAYFGYDSRRVLEEIFSFPTGRVANVLYIDEARYREHFAKVQEIAKAIATFVSETLFPEFYADAVFSLGMNMKLCDEAAFLDVAAAAHWELAGLGGLEATQKWLKEHEPQIREIFEAAQRETGKPSPIAQQVLGEAGLQSDGVELCPSPSFYVTDRQNPLSRLNVQAMAADYKARGADYVISGLLSGRYDR